MHKYLFCILLILSTFPMLGQGICSGNLGENIFTKGDFGSGTAPVLLTNPGIAPGYSYSTTVPFDGSYSICSRSNALAGLFGTWLSITDNSNDPNGYMMVVNASYEPGIFYEETVEGLCENTLYEFSADIINIVKNDIPNHIDPNVTFLIDGVSVYSTGDIPKSEKWEQFGFSFVTDGSQSSITLTLQNNAPGGTGNDLALDNISFRPCGPSSFIGLEGKETTIFLCIDDEPLTVVADIDGDDGQQFAIQWQSSSDGETWTTLAGSTSSSITHTNFEPGDYFYRYYSAGNAVNIENSKCRIISDVITVTILPDTYPVEITICEGLILDFGTQSLTQTGAYEESFQSRFGCDSIVLLDLEFVPALDFIIDTDTQDPSCFGFEDGSVLVNSVSGGNGGISYQLVDANNNSDGISFGDGSYFLNVTDQYGCAEQFEIILVEPDQITVDLGQDTTLKLGSDIFLDPEYSMTFSVVAWTGNGEFDCVDCSEVIYLPFNSGMISVAVIDEFGCSSSDSIFVNVDNDNLVILPNVFSPNEDGVNDEFTINYFGMSVNMVNEFRVFDRWGGLIHKSDNLTVSSGQPIWDGYAGTRLLGSGVYSYYIKVEYINGDNEEIIGNVTLLR